MTVLFIAQLVFVYFTGIYRYCIYTEQKLTDAHIDQSVYVMYMNNPFDVIYAGETLKLQNQIKTMPGVKDILAYKRFLGSTYQGTEQGILFYNDSFLSFFTMDEYGTEVFSDTGLDHNRVQCIAVGPLYDQLKIGETFPLSIGQKQVQAVLTGRVEYPYYYPTFSKSSSKLTADDLFTAFEGNTLLFKETAQTLDYTGIKQDTLLSGCDFFMIFDQEASEAEKESCLDAVYEQGYTTVSYQELMANTKEHTQKKTAEHLPFPLYLTVTAAVSFLCMAILFVHKKMEDFAVYYLCGCSRRKSYAVMVCSLSFIGFAAGLISSAVTAFYPYLGRKYGFYILYSIIDRKSLLFILGYFGLVLLISLLVPFLLYRKKTTIELKRRFES